MKIEKLHIKNFKSLADVEIIKPNPFTVFVGPNGSGKSNIFEAIEFSNYYYKFGHSSFNMFGGKTNIFNSNNSSLNPLKYRIIHNDIDAKIEIIQEQSGTITFLPDSYFSFKGEKLDFDLFREQLKRSKKNTMVRSSNSRRILHVSLLAKNH